MGSLSERDRPVEFKKAVKLLPFADSISNARHSNDIFFVSFMVMNELV
jgi:hypothetical protein